MDFYHPATVRHLQLLFTTTHSHRTHVQIPANADIYFASLSCGHVLVCLVCVCVCEWMRVCVRQCFLLTITCRLGLQGADKASFACWKALFFSYCSEGAATWEWLVNVSCYTLHQSIHLSSSICSQNIMIYPLYEQPVNSLCVWSKHRRIHPAMVGQYFIVWRQQKHMNCCSFFQL